ncbi:hypothetical protein HYH03_014885 [Edaphochlamys debaryana]|uniref:Uncharacterized protein n=1 Tax=Edaphochlamys debaryana TaxID=47281 RepID=A0A835XLU4_9CHLO|nr:hypothetical protein HYH03_014885 [Edaphochlamys debaryana]|eukprot:KAG2486438.1 hypothetical protein HYH03_014885 [Edaphochlamys debaryana]
MATLRSRMSQGEDPEEVLNKKTHSKNRSMTYKTWVAKAFQSLPNSQGTVKEIGAILFADPNIAPMLDLRPTVWRKSVPRWSASITGTLKAKDGFYNTGLKRDGLVVYGYDPQAINTATKRKRTPKKGQAGLPYLGKRSKNAN